MSKSNTNQAMAENPFATDSESSSSSSRPSSIDSQENTVDHIVGPAHSPARNALISDTIPSISQTFHKPAPQLSRGSASSRGGVTNFHRPAPQLSRGSASSRGGVTNLTKFRHDSIEEEPAGESSVDPLAAPRPTTRRTSIARPGADAVQPVTTALKAKKKSVSFQGAFLPSSLEDEIAPGAEASPLMKPKKKSVSFQGGFLPSSSEDEVAPGAQASPFRTSVSWNIPSNSAGQSLLQRPAAATLSSTGVSARRNFSLPPHLCSDLDTIPASPPLGTVEDPLSSTPVWPPATNDAGIPKNRRSSSAPLNGIGRGNWYRRKSSSVAPAPRRQSYMRRMSQFNPFDSSFAEEAEGTDASGVTEPPRAKLRSKSTTAMGEFFRMPFGAAGEEEDIRPIRRQSAPMVRRPSQFQRMMSVVAEPNPIPERYRSKSVSSLAYFVTPLASSNTKLPIFEDDIELQKENVQEYLAAVERFQASAKRKPWQSNTWQGCYFFIVVALVYFIFIGRPIWPGVATVYYRWLRTAHLKSLGVLIFWFWAILQAFLPLCCVFEQEVDDVELRDASDTALVIPAYKAAKVLPETIEAALKIFKPEQIFIVNNGNSPQPLDDTAGVCATYGVNHAWVPIGSKIVAEFVGVALCKQYKYIMLIDDDVHLPPNLPIVTDRINEKTKCIGYTIKSTGENGAKGTIIQQCQDMEYKASGLTRTFSGKYGSATFPHGAIILWDREVLQDLFNVHPGYTISEDWYFGHAARSSGYRIEFCSQVFVETETPPAFIKSTSAARGGFGEMTVYKQRFGRWNYFFLFRIWEDSVYMLFSWRLGLRRELVTKIWVMVEIYDSIMAILRPFVIVITAIAAWKLLLIMTAGLMGMYLLSFSIFNGYHLRRKGEMVSWKIIPQYFLMKFTLLWVNCMSVYYGLFDYARFFKVKHERVIENKRALEAAYQVRIGQNMVPLDTKIGEAVQEMALDPDTLTAVVQESSGNFSLGKTSEAVAEKESGAGSSRTLDEKVDENPGVGLHALLDGEVVPAALDTLKEKELPVPVEAGNPFETADFRRRMSSAELGSFDLSRPAVIGINHDARRRMSSVEFDPLDASRPSIDRIVAVLGTNHDAQRRRMSSADLDPLDARRRMSSADLGPLDCARPSVHHLITIDGTDFEGAGATVLGDSFGGGDAAAAVGRRMRKSTL